MRETHCVLCWLASRSSWRAAGRALKFVVQQVAGTDEIQSLKDARTAMEYRINRLAAARVPDNAKGVSAASKACRVSYESVQSVQACEAVDAILGRAEEDGHSAVTVAGKRHAFFWRCVFRSLRQCLVLTLEALYWLFAAASCLKYAHTGSRVWSFRGVALTGSYLLCPGMARTYPGFR